MNLDELERINKDRTPGAFLQIGPDEIQALIDRVRDLETKRMNDHAKCYLQIRELEEAVREAEQIIKMGTFCECKHIDVRQSAPKWLSKHAAKGEET